MSRYFHDSVILDKGAELFQEYVDQTELMDMYFRGFIPTRDLMDRLEALRMTAGENAVDALQREEVESA